MHKFDPINKNKLDNPQRRKMLPPEIVLEKLGLKEDDDMADIGCGIGYFTIPASKIISSENNVYAIDISDEMLQEVDRRSKEKDINNISIVKSSEYDLKLESEQVSFTLMVNVLHEIDDKVRMLKEVHRILKSDGRIALIEIQKKKTSCGPPMEHRIDEDEVLSLLKDAGFEFKKREEFADNFYGIVAVKI